MEFSLESQAGGVVINWTSHLYDHCAWLNLSCFPPDLRVFFRNFSFLLLEGQSTHWERNFINNLTVKCDPFWNVFSWSLLLSFADFSSVVHWSITSMNFWTSLFLKQLLILKLRDCWSTEVLWVQLFCLCFSTLWQS